MPDSKYEKTQPNTKPKRQTIRQTNSKLIATTAIVNVSVNTRQEPSSPPRLNPVLPYTFPDLDFQKGWRDTYGHLRLQPDQPRRFEIIPQIRMLEHLQ